MHSRLLLTFTALLLIAADEADPAKREMAALEGAYTMTSLEVEGQKVEGQRIEGSELLIKEGKYIVTTRGNKHETLMDIDPAHKPKQIDMTFADGPNKDKTLQGIYEIDGDTLKVCRSINPDASRPKEFTTAPGTGLFLVVWKRQPK